MNKITLVVFTLVILMGLEATLASPASDPRVACGKSGADCEDDANCCSPIFKCGVEGKCETQIFKRQACKGENEKCGGSWRPHQGHDECCDGLRCKESPFTKSGLCVSIIT